MWEKVEVEKMSLLQGVGFWFKTHLWEMLIMVVYVTAFIIYQSLKTDNIYTRTIAIYNGTHLQDFLIKCNGSLLVSKQPLGFPIFVGEKDLKNKRLCD